MKYLILLMIQLFSFKLLAEPESIVETTAQCLLEINKVSNDMVFDISDKGILKSVVYYDKGGYKLVSNNHEVDISENGCMQKSNSKKAVKNGYSSHVTRAVAFGLISGFLKLSKEEIREASERIMIKCANVPDENLKEDLGKVMVFSNSKKSSEPAPSPHAGRI